MFEYELREAEAGDARAQNSFSIFGTPITHDWEGAYTEEEASKLRQKNQHSGGEKPAPASASHF